MQGYIGGRARGVTYPEDREVVINDQARCGELKAIDRARIRAGFRDWHTVTIDGHSASVIDQSGHRCVVAKVGPCLYRAFVIGEFGQGRVESSSRFGAKSLLLARQVGRKMLGEVCNG